MEHVSLSTMGDITAYDDEESVLSWLSYQLQRGRLALVLGAGASQGFGFPEWDLLVERLFMIEGGTRPESLSAEEAAEVFLSDYCDGDRIKFAERVGSELYKNVDLSFDSLRQSDLLLAVGALVMASRRGSVDRIISFNFDVSLETYLNYHGLRVDSVDSLPSWSGSKDVSIFHPHGLLRMDEAPTRPIIFTQNDYDRDDDTLRRWDSIILDTLSSNVCLFVGLSGRDRHLMRLLHKVHDGGHVALSTGYHFWGLRISDDSADERRGIWENRGVGQVTLSYDRLPRFLFDVCQAAAGSAPEP